MSAGFNFQLKDTYSSLQKSAEAGCECCALVVESLESSDKESTTRGGPISLRRDGTVMFVRFPYIDAITVHIGEEPEKPQIRVFTAGGIVYLSICLKRLTKSRGSCSRRLSADREEGDSFN